MKWFHFVNLMVKTSVFLISSNAQNGVPTFSPILNKNFIFINFYILMGADKYSQLGVKPFSLYLLFDFVES